MKHLPPEIESLIWAIAESGEPRAVLESEQRYPQYTIQLHERIKMVRALKQGGQSKIPNRPPEFRPRPATRSEVPKPLWISAAVLGLAAIGFGAFTITASLSKPAVPVVTKPNLDPPKLPSADVVVRGDSDLGDRGMRSNNPTSPNSVDPRTPPPVQQAEEPPSPAYLVKKNLRVKRAGLHAALMLIGEAGGLTIEIAPGLPNPDVVLDYQQKTPIEMLKALGEDYAFSAFDEGENKILIIPARDSSTSVPPIGGKPNESKHVQESDGTNRIQD